MSAALLPLRPRSLALDGSAGRVTTPFVPSGSVSVEVWANLTDNAAAYCLWGTALVGGFTALLRVETNGLVTFSASTSAAAVSWPPGTAAAPGTWMHYVLTYDLAHAILFTNGVSQGSNPYSTAWNGGAFGLGVRGTISNLLKGSLFRARAWNAILVGADAVSLYRGQGNVARSSLQCELLFRDRNAILRDSSGHGNAGALSVSGAAWNPAVPLPPAGYPPFA